MMFASVRISVPHQKLDHIFDYIIPERLENKLCKGMRVYVPFGGGNRIIEGYVVDITDKTDYDISKLKQIERPAEEYSIVSQNKLKLADWMQEKYYCTLNACMMCIVPKFSNEKKFACISLNKELPDLEKIISRIKSSKQKRIVEMLMDGGTYPVSHVKSLLDVESTHISALIKKGLITTTYMQQYRGNYNGKINIVPPPVLTSEQSLAVDYISSRVDEGSIKPILLHGVTGSGKTEVYLRVIEKILAKGKTAIVLVPEISLTPQTVERFVSRFGDKVAVTHSKMSDGERYDQWTRAYRGEISIMVGPRSAIFTPFENLGIVIIDEEHESTYKAEQQSPKYDAREVAEQLGKLYGSMTLLGSATPSIKSYYMAKTGKYDIVELKNRVNNLFPQINIVDMRNELVKKNMSVFSTVLQQEIAKNIENQNQTIIFLNRRGYSPFVSCRNCGYVMKCRSCNVNYTYHKGINRLMCHYCGEEVQMPSNCPECGSAYIKYFGAGTEKIQTEIERLFPSARVLRMDADTIKKKGGHMDILEKFRNGEADILIGTQMIAKGLDFPNVTLVGVIAADLSLNISDYSAAEATFQLLMQVSGRAGRADKNGRVFIQTYSPEHYSINYVLKNDYEGFFNEEITFRRQLDYPPFSSVFVIMLTGKNEKRVIDTINYLYDIMEYYNIKRNVCKLYKPVPEVITKIKNKYRWRIIAKCSSEDKLKRYVLFCLDKLYNTKKLTDVSVSLLLRN